MKKIAFLSILVLLKWAFMGGGLAHGESMRLFSQDEVESVTVFRGGQSNVPEGYQRMRATHTPDSPAGFYRIEGMVE